MTDDADKGARDAAAIRFPPPLICLGFLLLGPLIDRWLALPPWPMPWWIGAIVTVAGLAFTGLAFGLLRGAGEDPQPWTATGHIVDTGLYAHTRNPIYLGMAITMLGLALAFQSAMGVLLVPVAVGVVGGTVIAREEAYLEGKFGEPYRAYLARVRRWL